jgi:hypothetical protein
MLKPVILDTENQFMQVKTQVAIALADLHLLQRRSRTTSTSTPTGCAKPSSLSIRKTTHLLGPLSSGDELPADE